MNTPKTDDAKVKQMKIENYWNKPDVPDDECSASASFVIKPKLVESKK